MSTQDTHTGAHMSELAEGDIPTAHEYDGIREFDNRLPNWWLFTLYGAMVFSVFYWMYYHTLHAGPAQMDAYKDELVQADKEALAREEALAKAGKLPNVTDESLVALAKDNAAVERGHAVYTQNCLACHGDKGQGLVGPNLTDNAWIHGSNPSVIHKTVSDGVITKGMPAWKPVLGSSKVTDVVAYLMTIRNTNIPGKAAEGTADGAAGAPTNTPPAPTGAPTGAPNTPAPADAKVDVKTGALAPTETPQAASPN